MGTLNLGPESLITSPERDQFVALRRRYMALGNKHLDQFKRWYPTLETADALFVHLPSRIDAVFTDTTTSVATDLATYGIYDVSEESIRTDLEARTGAAGDGLKRVQDRYFSIIGKSAELEAQRNEARDSRGRIAGGGFGVEGAAQGVALAAVANAAIGLTHGIANLTAKAASALGDRAKKRDLLNDPATTTDLGDFFIQVALQGSELVAALVNKAKSAPTFETVSGEQRRKSAAIVENVRAGRVPEPELQRLLVQAIALDPFNGTAWVAWLDRFGDGDGSVGNSAEVLGVGDVESHKSHLMAERRAALSWTTPEECRANCPLLEQKAEWLGIPFDNERARITSLAEQLDRERRTVNGVEYTSLIEAAEARQAHEEQVQRTMDANGSAASNLEPTTWQRLWWNPNPTKPARFASRPVQRAKPREFSARTEAALDRARHIVFFTLQWIAVAITVIVDLGVVTHIGHSYLPGASPLLFWGTVSLAVLCAVLLCPHIFIKIDIKARFAVYALVIAFFFVANYEGRLAAEAYARTTIAAKEKQATSQAQLDRIIAKSNRKGAEAAPQDLGAIDQRSLISSAPFQPPSLTWKGKYTGKTEGASGALSIKRAAAEKVRVNLRLSGEDCNGGIEFTAKPEGNLIRHVEPYDAEAQQQCTLMLVNNGGEIVIQEHQCMSQHGFSCSFNGTLKRR